MRSAARAFLLAPALAVAVGTPGCSFLFSEGAPVDHERQAHFLCGESMVPPVLDTVATGLYGLSAAQGRRNRETQADYDSRRAISGSFAVVALASAVYGFVQVSDCRTAKEARRVEIARASTLPHPYGLPPYGAPPPRWPPDWLHPPPGPAAPPVNPEAPQPEIPPAVPPAVEGAVESAPMTVPVP